MTAKTDKTIINHITNGKSIEDVVTLLTMTDVFESKSVARTYVTELLEVENLVPVKKETKVGQLKKWFLSQDNPTSVTKEQIREQCVTIGMKGGSIQYYINSYSLAIELSLELKGTDIGK